MKKGAVHSFVLFMLAVCLCILPVGCAKKKEADIAVDQNISQTAQSQTQPESRKPERSSAEQNEESTKENRTQEEQETIERTTKKTPSGAGAEKPEPEQPAEAPTKGVTEQEQPAEAPTEEVTEQEQPTEAPTEEVTEQEQPTEAPTEENTQPEIPEQPGIRPPVISEAELTAENAVSQSDMIAALKKSWKVQLPVLRDGSTSAVKEVGKNTAIPFEGYFDKWFYYDPSDRAIVFYTLVKGEKTANTNYTRSELREVMGETNSDNWGWTGTHRLCVEEMVTMVPANGKAMVCQVHAIYPNGDNGPVPLKVIYEGNSKRLAVSFLTATNTNANKTYYFNGVELGQKFRVTTEFIAGSAYVTIESDGRKETYGYDFLGTDGSWTTYLNYFKAGNYIQDSTDTAEGAGSVVRLYAIDTYHDTDNANNRVYPIEALKLQQTQVTLRPGERTQLVPQFTPLQTTNKGVKWAVVEGSSAAVDKNGNLVAIKEGKSVVMAMSEDNMLKTAICEVIVKDVQKEQAKLIYEQGFGTAGEAIKLLEHPELQVGAGADNLISIENGENPYLRIDDSNPKVSGKFTYVFPKPVAGPVTLRFRIKVDAIRIKDAQSAKPSVSYCYLYTYGIHEEGGTPSVLGCIRNLGTRSGENVINSAWGLTKGYKPAPLNNEQTQFEYGEWADITMITTPDDGSADSGTTTYYINGYKVGSQMENFSAAAYISQVDFSVGTKDLMDIAIDDIKIYDGVMLPESSNTKVPEKIEVQTVPAVMETGDSYMLSAKASPEDAYEQLCYEVVSGDSMTVSSDGFLIAVKEGSSTIKISSVLDKNITYEKTVTVVKRGELVRAEKVTLLDSDGSEVAEKLLIAPESSRKLKAVITPENATNQEVLYQVVEGGDIVTISEDGVITGLKSGNARVKAVSAENEAVFCEITIVVVKNFAPGTVLFSDSFTNALNPEKWTVESQNTGHTENKIVDGAFVFRDENPSGQPRAYVTFEPVRGAVTIRFKLRVDADTLLDNGKASSVRISVGSGKITATAAEAFTIKNTATVSEGVITDRRFQYSLPYQDGKAKFEEVEGHTIELGEWNEIAMVVRTNDGSDNANTSALYINGEKAADGIANKVSYDILDKVCFGTGTGDLTAYAIDDLEIRTGEYMPETPETVLVHEQDFESELVQTGSATNPEVRPSIRYWNEDSSIATGITAVGGNHVLQLKDESTAKASKALYHFDKIAGGIYTIAFDTKVVCDEYDTASGLNITLGSTETGNAANSKNYELFRLKLSLDKTGDSPVRKMQTRQDASQKDVTLTHEAATYQPGNVQQLKLIVDTVCKTVTIYVDGTMVCENSPMNDKLDYEGIDHIFFGTNTGDQFEGQIDNLCIYQGIYG